MKGIIKILTIYLIALSFVPCGDGGGGIVEIINHLFDIEHQHISDHEHHSRNCGDDDCSPFCVCICCSIAINVPEEITKFRPFTLWCFNERPTNLSNIYSFTFSSSIWHPPTFS